MDETTLETLVAELRQNASNDVEFVQRVALACIALVETKADPPWPIPNPLKGSEEAQSIDEGNGE
jgi:hypothetical protein